MASGEVQFPLFLKKTPTSSPWILHWLYLSWAASLWAFLSAYCRHIHETRTLTQSSAEFPPPVNELQSFRSCGWSVTCCGVGLSYEIQPFSQRSHLCPEQRWWKVCLPSWAYLAPGWQNWGLALESCEVERGLFACVHFGNWVCRVCSQCVTLACPPQSSLTCPCLTLPQSNQDIVSNLTPTVTGRHLIWHFTET